MKKNAMGPVIEQRRFEFDGHVFYVPLKVAVNVRASKKMLLKRARLGIQGAAKRCTPVNFHKVPTTPVWAKRGISRKEYYENEKRFAELIENTKVDKRHLKPLLMIFGEEGDENRFFPPVNEQDVTKALKDRILGVGKKAFRHYYHYHNTKSVNQTEPRP